MTKIKIHPAAECVRLMDEEELASLAASIEAHGLRDPIIMGRVNGATSEMLIDGRNRLRACEIAGVEPRFETMQFEDDEAIKAFVADKSEHRNITKGQKAMRPAPPGAGKGRQREKGARN
jgi:ParB-like chromosome segregation protein Spo0J